MTRPRGIDGRCDDASSYGVVVQVSHHDRHSVRVDRLTVRSTGEHRTEAPETSIQQLRPEMEQDARDGVAKVRAARDKNAALAALKNLEAAARENINRMPAIVSAARARCTVGEICGVLRGVYGEYRPG